MTSPGSTALDVYLASLDSFGDRVKGLQFAHFSRTTDCCGFGDFPETEELLWETINESLTSSCFTVLTGLEEGKLLRNKSLIQRNVCTFLQQPPLP